MTQSAFAELVADWEQKQAMKRDKVPLQVPVYDTDRVKIQALADVYGMSEQDILAALIHHGLFELESHIPYRKGSRVVGHENGQDVYEDVGVMPRYIAKIQEITRRH